jgi:hypothetical protein
MPTMVPAKPAVVTSVEVTSEMVASSEMTTSKMTTSVMFSAMMLRQCRLCHKEKPRKNGRGRQMLDHIPLP